MARPYKLQLHFLTHDLNQNSRVQNNTFSCKIVTPPFPFHHEIIMRTSLITFIAWRTSHNSSHPLQFSSKIRQNKPNSIPTHLSNPPISLPFPPIQTEILKKTMPGSPPPIHHSHGETTGIHGSSPKRPCDFCNKSTAILYCRADTAKLCLSCDREVHSTNQLFTKHTRSLLCDNCDSSPAAIFCSTDAAVHCQNCDWEAHSKTNSNSPTAAHDRRPLEGFAGCPSVSDLLSILGFEDLSKKGLLLGGGCGGGGGSESYGSGDGFSDYLVWETPSFVSLDDLIVSSGSEHNYQAMGVPPLPKNRNAALGTYKDELLRQLRELAKSEPNVDDGQDVVKPVSEFQPTENIQIEGRSSGFEHKLEPKIYSSYEANTFQWSHDGCDAGGQEFSSDQFVGHNNEMNCVVPDEKFYSVHSSSHANANHEGGLLDHTAIAENVPLFPVVREINSQERETAISRYKEKKKSRRYDKHIRYESRKVRAESRTRIKGRFAKLDR